MSYEPRDRVFARVRGHPYWPARINILPEGTSVPRGKYPIFFYGTHEVYFVAPKDIHPYEQWKHRIDIPRKNKHLFQRGLEEIEQNPDVLLLGTDPKAGIFLSQFYQVKSSKSPQDTKSLESPEFPVETQSSTHNPQELHIVDLDATPPEVSDKNSLLPPTPPSSKRTPKYSARKSNSSSSATKRTKRPSVTVAEGSKANKPKRKERMRFDDEVVVKETDVRSPSSSHNEQSDISSTDRPIRKSAAKVVNSKPYQYIFNGPSDKDLNSKPSDAGSSDNTGASSTSKTDSQEKPEEEGNSVQSSKEKTTTKAPSSPLVDSDSPSATPLSSPARDEDKRPKRRVRKSNDEGTARKRVRLSSSSSSQRSGRKPSTSQAEKSRLKVSNVSMTPEELNARMKNRLNTQNDAKQLSELDTENKLRHCNFGIQRSLIRGQENLEACIQRMDVLEKLPITLSLLVKCAPIVQTIKKCTRYARSDGVRISALRIHNKFWSIYENATAEEMRNAENVLADVRKNSSNQGGPATVEAIFGNKDSGSSSTSSQQSAKTPSGRSVESEKPPAAAPVLTELVQPSTIVHPRADIPPPLALSPLPPSFGDALPSPSAYIRSDSEGLAVSDNESPKSDLGFQRSLPPPPNSGEIISAAKRAFHQHTTAAKVEHRHPPGVSFPKANPDVYEPQPLYPSSQPLPTYTPFHGEIVDGPSQPLVQNVPENRRERVQVRERPRSPHALPHPLEHYQKILKSGEQQPQLRQPYAQPSTQPSGDLDSRIAHFLGHSQLRGEEQQLHFVENPPHYSHQYHQPPLPHSVPLHPVGALPSTHTTLQRPPTQNIMRGPYEPSPMNLQHVMRPPVPPPRGMVYSPMPPPGHSAYPSARPMTAGPPGPPYPAPPSQHPYPQPQGMIRAPVDSQQWPPTQMRYQVTPEMNNMYKQQRGGSNYGPH